MYLWLYLDFVVFLFKFGLVLLEQFVLSLFFFACPQRDRDIRSKGSNWLNPCKTSLTKLDGLQWRKKINMRDQEILSKYFSKNPSSDTRPRWWTTFSQILQWLSIGDTYSFSSHFGSDTPFKVQFNFYIPIFEVQINMDAIDKWLNLLEGYFSVHDFSNCEKVTCALLKATPHVKDL